MRWRLPTTPLFLQALGLVVATLIAAEITTVVVVINLPPPPPDVPPVEAPPEPVAPPVAAPPLPEQAVADVKADVEEIRERAHR